MWHFGNPDCSGTEQGSAHPGAFKLELHSSREPALSIVSEVEERGSLCILSLSTTPDFADQTTVATRAAVRTQVTLFAAFCNVTLFSCTLRAV